MIRWLHPDAHEAPAQAVCPNCGNLAPYRPVLAATAASGAELRLVACLGCGAHYFSNVEAGNYEAEAPGGGAALAFYLQQGADIGGIAMRLTSLDRPAGTQYLEIGCGFGFGLDFARHGLGWQVKGIDPSPFAACGRELLGLPIESRYFGSEDSAEAAYDVVHASEFLEHVPAPLAVLRDIRAALRPDGMLLLTTPAAEMIAPTTSEGLLIPLLSVGWHVVIQTVASLTMLLGRAGFENVQVTREGAQLVAYAGGGTPKPAEDRSAYQNWLQARAAAVPAISDLGLGLRARLFRERAGAGKDAADAWVDLNDAVRKRFGRDLASWCGLNSQQPSATLEALAKSEPLCLAGVLLMQGWRLEQAGNPAESYFEGTLGASRRLRHALRAIGSDDGDAEDVGFAAERELISYAAARGDADINDRIEALQASGPRDTGTIRRQCFVSLVNHGHLAVARRFTDVIDQVRAVISQNEVLTHEEASTLFCAAVLELQTEKGRFAEAVTWLAALRRVLLQSFAVGRTESARILFWPAVEAEALGLRLCNSPKEAAKLLERVTAETAQMQGFPARRPG